MRVAVRACALNHTRDKSEVVIQLYLANFTKSIRIWEEKTFDCTKYSLDEVLKAIDPLVTWFWSNRIQHSYYEIEVPEEYLLTHENEEVRKFAVWKLKQLEKV